MRKQGIVALLSVGLMSGGAVLSTQVTEPNLVVIMVDDLADSIYDAAAEAGWLPNIEALRARSHEFPNHVSPTPSCCPARADFLSALHAENHGVWNNTRGHLFDETETVSVWLQDAGYQTALIGKYMNKYGDGSSSDLFHQPHYVPRGWFEWQSIVGANPVMYGYWLNENGVLRQYTSDYQTDLLRDRAIAWMQYATEPFFLLLAPTAPHGETGISKLACDAGERTDWQIRPAPRHIDTPFVSAPRPPSFNEADVSDKPWGSLVAPLTDSNIACIDKVFASRVAAMRAVDDLVGEVVSAAPTNTVVVWVSDQGYLFGQHRFIAKGIPYEESLRTRMWMALPGETARTIHDALVAITDIGPTLLELANAPIPVRLDGISLLPIMTGATQDVRHRVRLYARNDGFKTFDGHRFGPRDHRYADMVVWWWRPWGAREAYDLTSDPHQLHNLRDGDLIGSNLLDAREE